MFMSFYMHFVCCTPHRLLRSLLSRPHCAASAAGSTESAKRQRLECALLACNTAVFNKDLGINMNRNLQFLLLVLGLVSTGQSAPCVSTGYDVAGMMTLESFSDGCGSSYITECWSQVEVFQCKDKNTTAGTDGSVAIWPLWPVGVQQPGNETTLCLEAYIDVVGSGARGYIHDEAGHSTEIKLEASTSTEHHLIMTVLGNQCLYAYQLQYSTSNILGAAPQTYGRWNGAWSTAGKAAVAVAAAIASAAVLHLL